MGGKGGCRDLSEYAVRSVTGTGYDQCPVSGDGFTSTVFRTTVQVKPFAASGSVVVEA